MMCLIHALLCYLYMHSLIDEQQGLHDWCIMLYKERPVNGPSQWWLLAKQLLTMSARLGFSMAAVTRSLSFSCLLTAASVECVPGVTLMST